MNAKGKAFSELEMVVYDWACEHEELIRVPHILARHVADFVFDELLMIPAEEIDSEG